MTSPNTIGTGGLLTVDLFRYRNPVMTNQSPESLSCDISPPTFYLAVNVRNFYCTHSCMLRSIEELEMASGSRCRVEYDYYDYERALINQAANHLGYSSLKREQEAAIFYFVVGNDVFVSLPTVLVRVFVMAFYHLFSI